MALFVNQQTLEDLSLFLQWRPRNCTPFSCCRNFIPIPVDWLGKPNYLPHPCRLITGTSVSAHFIISAVRQEAENHIEGNTYNHLLKSHNTP